MGINGLLQQLKSVSAPTHVKRCVLSLVRAIVNDVAAILASKHSLLWAVIINHYSINAAMLVKRLRLMDTAGCTKVLTAARVSSAKASGQMGKVALQAQYTRTERCMQPQAVCSNGLLCK